MKNYKTILGACILISLSSISLTSCGTKKIDASSPAGKCLKSADSIAKLIEQGKGDSVYFRMSDDYKTGVSEEQFVNKWHEISENKPAGKYKVELFSSSSPYIKTLATYEIEKKKVFAAYTFFEGSIYPLDVKYLSESDIKKLKKTKTKKSPVPDYSQWDNTIKNFPRTEAALYETPLKDLCEPYFKLGTGITGASPNVAATKSPEYMAIVKKHFSSCTYTNLMKPSYLLNQQKSMANAKKGDENPVLNFEACDPLLKYAKENNIPVRGHTLVWHTQVPSWFFKVGYSDKNPLTDRETMKFRMESYIRQYLTYVQENYPGVVYCWDVVNEAVDPAGDKSVNWSCRKVNDTYPNMWYEALGTDYVELAFTYARKYVEPGVKLYYNDYGTTDRTKREYIYNLLCFLNEKGLVDGMGMQGYWGMKNPSLAEIRDTINLYASTGLEIQLTEWSMQADNDSDEKMTEQAEHYAEVLRLLQKLDTQGGGNANITVVTFFGLMNNYMFSDNDKTNCRPFDKNLQPNKMFYAIKGTFENFYN